MVIACCKCPFGTTKKRVWSLIISCCLSLSGCGGGGGGAPPLTVTTPADPANQSGITDTNIAFLFEDMPTFDSARSRAFRMDVVTGQVTSLADDAAIRQFLNKQPDPLETALYPYQGEDAIYVGLSHLSHNIYDNAQRNPSISLGGVNQTDPGHYFLFGRQGPAPNASFTFEMTSHYFCSYCDQNFGTADGTLAFDVAHQSALFKMANDDLSLTLPLVLGDEGFDIAPLSDEFLLTHQGTDYEDATLAADGHFFGPEAENVGLLFSIIQSHGLISASSIGHR